MAIGRKERDTSTYEGKKIRGQEEEKRGEKRSDQGRADRHLIIRDNVHGTGRCTLRAGVVRTGAQSVLPQCSR